MHFTRVLWWPAKMTIQSARKCVLPIFEHVSTSVKSDSLMLIQYQWCHPMRFCWKIAINYYHRKNNVNYCIIECYHQLNVCCFHLSLVIFFIYRISKADQINFFTVIIIKFIVVLLILKYTCMHVYFEFITYWWVGAFELYFLINGSYFGIWLWFTNEVRFITVFGMNFHVYSYQC